MDFREKLQTVLQKLGLMDKAKTQTGLTQSEWAQVVDSYKKEYQSTLQEDLAAAQSEGANETPAITEEQMGQVQAILGSIIPNQATEGQEGEGNDAQQTSGEQLVVLATAIKEMVAGMKTQATADVPVNVVGITGPSMYVGNGDCAKYLHGIESPMFSMEKRWNQVAAKPECVVTLGSWNQDSINQFRDELKNYSSSLKERYEFLQSQNLLNDKRLQTGDFGTSYPGLANADLHDQYIVRRQDALIARVLAKRDLTQFFPVRYGIQDRDVIFNAFFTEVSQAWQEGEVYKGSMTLESEVGHVDDGMIKLKFGPMKELERKYIGYLNKEGSDPIKWSLIEFCILNSLETAQVEQNKRRMRGLFVKPESGVAGNYLNAGTGVLYTLIRYVHENKLLLHDDSTYNSYSKTDMLDAVKEFIGDVISKCTEDMDLDQHVLYLNKMHQTWWTECIRTAYGKDTDFNGPNSYLNIVPDTQIRIKWLPYLGQMPLMFLDIPGNIQFLEDKPGEMLGMSLESFMELVRGWSVWKEGCSASFTGRNFSSYADLLANNYEWQQIFMNKPSVKLAADATTANAQTGFWIETIANTAATTLTDITNAKAGVAYIIECGDTTNATKIAKSGKFSEVTAWTPTKKGDYIMVILNKDGKFVELERQVNGVRTIVKALQPNIPGAR